MPAVRPAPVAPRMMISGFYGCVWEVPNQELGWRKTWVFFFLRAAASRPFTTIFIWSLIMARRCSKEVGEFNRIGYRYRRTKLGAQSTFYKLPGITYPRRTAKGFFTTSTACGTAYLPTKSSSLWPKRHGTLLFARILELGTYTGAYSSSGPSWVQLAKPELWQTTIPWPRSSDNC